MCSRPGNEMYALVFLVILPELLMLYSITRAFSPIVTSTFVDSGHILSFIMLLIKFDLILLEHCSDAISWL